MRCVLLETQPVVKKGIKHSVSAELVTLLVNNRAYEHESLQNVADNHLIRRQDIYNHVANYIFKQVFFLGAKLKAYGFLEPLHVIALTGLGHLLEHELELSLHLKRHEHLHVQVHKAVVAIFHLQKVLGNRFSVQIFLEVVCYHF